MTDTKDLIERLRHPGWTQAEQDGALIALDALQAENAFLRSLVHGEKPGTRAVPIGSEVEQARAKRAALLKEPTT